jgi:hypothetical protein
MDPFSPLLDERRHIFTVNSHIYLTNFDLALESPEVPCLVVLDDDGATTSCFPMR